MESAIVSNVLAERSIRDALIAGVLRLTAVGIDSARLDAELLLAHALEMSREQLVVAQGVALESGQLAGYESLLRRRLEREPIAYILGSQEFWSLDFQVCRDVLIPRPETEKLIEVVLAKIGTNGSAKPLRIADLGTGSGAIAITLATELPAAQLMATDISPAALAVAKDNAATHGVMRRIDFRAGNLCQALSGCGERFDMIVSNPPYIESAVIPTLAPEVHYWEPRGALDGGMDGLDFYRRIAADADKFLAPGGLLALEIGAGLSRSVSSFFAAAGRYRSIAVYEDYAGRERVVTATNALST
jgi:release factor glutamine methyltransferase